MSRDKRFEPAESRSRTLARFLAFVLAGLLLFLMAPGSLPNVGAATTVRFPPRPNGVTNFITDAAGMMNAADLQAANTISKNLQSDRSTPMMVATISSLSDYGASGYTIERYAFELFSDWQIISGSRNTGILLLISEEDRVARIELGHDWGRSYDIQAQTIMNGQIIPRFKAGQFSAGILAGVRSLDSLARSQTAPPAYNSPSGGGGISAQLVLVIVGIGGFFAAVFYSVARTGTDGWGWATLKVLGSIAVFLLIASLFVVKTTATVAAAGGGGATGSW